MVYSQVLKKIAMHMPVLSGVLAERDRLRSELHSASQELSLLHAAVESGKNRGYCHCCRQETRFEIQGDWLRDQYFCANCFSIPRQRHIQYVLDTYFSGWDGMNIHESSPSNSFISRNCQGYSSSQYLEGISLGGLAAGVRCENLESLTFEDGSFDLFITQDVFEHVFNPDLALQEVMRVLRPGGAHVFTAPKHKHITLSRPRARMVAGSVEHMLEPEYHGNPVGDGRALVTWDYGDDFEELISNWSGFSATTYMTRDRSLGLDGEYLEVFVIRKAAVA